MFKSKYNSFFKIIFFFLSLSFVFTTTAYAADSFKVKHIKIRGLQGVKSGTVMAYLPIKQGQTMSPSKSGEIIRALYDTGFFSDVQLARSKNTLIIKVKERAVIGEVNVLGNKTIPKEQMDRALSSVGLVKGRVLDRAILDNTKHELEQQYHMRGRYNAVINTEVTPLSKNRVSVELNVDEGAYAKIEEIKIIGNKAFSTWRLKYHLSIAETNIFSFFTKKDKYTKQKLEASIEALTDFYLNHGYVKFHVISKQVTISPDKQKVYITININEGAQYKFTGYDVTGKLIYPRKKYDSLIAIKKNATFTRTAVTQSIEQIGDALGDKGYGLPSINANPTIDDKAHTVFVTFVINPGKRIYVRNIKFAGNLKTKDSVLRRNMTQYEGELLSLSKIKESTRKLRILGYLKNINLDTAPVKGKSDQVDLHYTVEEEKSLEFKASIGYGTNGPEFNTGVNQHNFMGTGSTAGFNFAATRWYKDYSLNYFDPYYTPMGIGAGFDFYYSDVKAYEDVSSFRTRKYGGNLNFSMPIDSKTNAALGIGYQHLRIKSLGFAPPTQYTAFVGTFGTVFDEIRLSAGINRNDYDRFPFPTKGINQSADALVAFKANGGSLNYYKLGYMAHGYIPLPYDFIFSLQGKVAYGNGFGSGSTFPFFENYYAGGVGVAGPVRGYDSYSLGPKDSTAAANALGGNALVSGSAGIILPYPFSRQTIRTTIFTDAGNVYGKNIAAAFTGPGAGPIRYSAGVSLDWQSPFGPISLSLAKPLNKQPGDIGDVFQFTFSTGF